MRAFKHLTEQEILALAIGLEEEDARHYDDLAAAVKATHPALAEEFHRLRARRTGIAIGCSICIGRSSASTSR